MLRALMLFLVLSAVVTLSAYSVVQINRTYVDPSRDNRQIATQIYYPVADSYTPDGSREAFPLIVFGHGWLLPVSTYATLRDELVSQGWIMALPTTEGSLFPDHLSFALDLDFVVQSVLAENYLSGSELLGQVLQYSVLMGHSMGGGAGVLAATNTVADALVTLAAADTDPSAITAAAQVTIPSLTISGASDVITPPAQHQVPIFENLASSYKSYVSCNGLGHLNIYTNALVLTAIRTWLSYSLNAEQSALADWMNLLEQNSGEWDYINSGYPEVAVQDDLTPEALHSLSVFPNPVRGFSSLSYSLERSCVVSLDIYDQRGRKLRSLFAGEQTAGTHTLSFDGRDAQRRILPSGIYFCRLTCGDFSTQRKMVLSK